MALALSFHDGQENMHPVDGAPQVDVEGPFPILE